MSFLLSFPASCKIYFTSRRATTATAILWITRVSIIHYHSSTMNYLRIVGLVELEKKVEQEALLGIGRRSYIGRNEKNGVEGGLP